MNSTYACRPLGLAHFSAIQIPPQELVPMAAKAGFLAVGLRLYPAFPGAPFYEVPAGSAASYDLQQRLNGEGVQVYDIEFVTLSADFVPDSIAPILEAANAIGAKRLSVCGDDPDRSRLVSNFAELCDLAARFDMGVDLENMGWRTVATFSDALAVVEQAGRPNGGALVDTLHFSRNGGEPSDLRTAAKSRIRSVQLCDAGQPAPQSHEEMIAEARSGRLAPGEGVLTLTAILRAVPEDAAISVEVPIGPSVDPQDHIGHLFAASGHLLDLAGNVERFR
ncbi:sugar phosphate isomerase [Phyllobacterium sophorae]|uniref:Sugar phosphate isomerase n=2 Tax=Phyllobacterium sophorae TaxID=1520277 RepID=A0A2P7B3R8_9HYPH|nr:sugar phosphate isomerase [Phyllobacterium sophorae]